MLVRNITRLTEILQLCDAFTLGGSSVSLVLLPGADGAFAPVPALADRAAHCSTLDPRLAEAAGIPLLSPKALAGRMQEADLLMPW